MIPVNLRMHLGGLGTKEHDCGGQKTGPCPRLQAQSLFPMGTMSLHPNRTKSAKSSRRRRTSPEKASLAAELPVGGMPPSRWASGWFLENELHVGGGQ